VWRVLSSVFVFPRSVRTAGLERQQDVGFDQHAEQYVLYVVCGLILILSFDVSSPLLFSVFFLFFRFSVFRPQGSACFRVGEERDILVLPPGDHGPSRWHRREQRAAKRNSAGRQGAALRYSSLPFSFFFFFFFIYIYV
jgi:hypothetical protein